ncbi:MAG: vWA domain-containing protein [Armatimonadota bacterium]
MHLLTPWWWLLLLPLAGTLIVLYLLKLRRRDFVVPSVFLWEQAQQDLQSNIPIQKLRKNLLLLLQLLVLLFTIAALSRPAMEWARAGGQSLVLIIDASASMQSTDVSPSRFAVAKKAGHKAIEALGPRDRMMLVAVGGNTRTLTAFTSDTRALHSALDRLEAGDTHADFRGALELVAGLANGKKGAEKPGVEIISDGAVSPVSLPVGMDIPIHFVKIGRRCDNIGIVMVNVRRKLSGRGFDGLVTVKNFGPKERQCSFEWYVNDQLKDAKDLTLASGGQHTEELADLPVTGGILRAKIDVRDDLAVDNEARIILPMVDQVPVVLATTGNIFLKTALSLDPTLDVTERNTVPMTLAPSAVLIADNVPVTSLPRDAAALLIGPESFSKLADAPGKALRTADSPAIADWDHQHPLLKHMDLSNLHVTTTDILEPASGVSELIETDAGPIALADMRQGRRIVCLGWDLHRSDFPLRVAFPIFVTNCIDWLSRQRQRAQVMNVHTGQLVDLPVPSSIQAVTLHMPDKKTERLAVTGTPLVIDRVMRAGIYRVTAKGMEEMQFAANLLDAGESDLTPHERLTLQGVERELTTRQGPVRTERELWRGLLFLALLLLCAEWWIFHRRIG